MLHNTIGQQLLVFVFNKLTNQPIIGDSANLRAYLSKDGGSVNSITDISAIEKDSVTAKGYYTFDLAQEETNATEILFTAVSTTLNSVCVCRPDVVNPVRLLGPNGNGDTPVDHNTGGTDNLQVKMLNGTAASNARIEAYIKSEYDIGIRSLQGETYTKVDGRWVAPLNLNQGVEYYLNIQIPNRTNTILVTVIP